MPQKSILELSEINSLASDDFLYAVRGTGVGRDKKIQGGAVIPKTVSQSTTGAIDLSAYYGDLVVYATNAITITFSNALLSGRVLTVVNIGVDTVVLAGAMSVTLISGTAATFISDASSLYQLGVDTQALFTMENEPGGFDLPSTDASPLVKIVGVNQDMYAQRFDDTTPWFVEGQFLLPPAMTTIVLFEVIGFAATAAASKNVEFSFYSSAKGTGEDWDVSLATPTAVSGDLATNSTQNRLDRFFFTETVSNLSFAINKQVKFRFARTTPSANNLVGDYYMTFFRISIPRV